MPFLHQKIEGKVGKINGVEEVKVLFNFSKVKAVYDENKVKLEELKTFIEKLGYQVVA